MARPLTEPSSGDGKTNCRKTATTSEGGNSRSYGTTCRSQGLMVPRWRDREKNADKKSFTIQSGSSRAWVRGLKRYPATQNGESVERISKKGM